MMQALKLRNKLKKGVAAKKADTSPAAAVPPPTGDATDAKKQFVQAGAAGAELIPGPAAGQGPQDVVAAAPAGTTAEGPAAPATGEDNKAGTAAAVEDVALDPIVGTPEQVNNILHSAGGGGFSSTEGAAAAARGPTESEAQAQLTRQQGFDLGRSTKTTHPPTRVFYCCACVPGTTACEMNYVTGFHPDRMCTPVEEVEQEADTFEDEPEQKKKGRCGGFWGSLLCKRSPKKKEIEEMPTEEELHEEPPKDRCYRCLHATCVCCCTAVCLPIFAVGEACAACGDAFCKLCTVRCVRGPNCACDCILRHSPFCRCCCGGLRKLDEHCAQECARRGPVYRLRDTNDRIVVDLPALRISNTDQLRKEFLRFCKARGRAHILGEKLSEIEANPWMKNRLFVSFEDERGLLEEVDEEERRRREKQAHMRRLDTLDPNVRRAITIAADQELNALSQKFDDHWRVRFFHHPHEQLPEGKLNFRKLVENSVGWRAGLSPLVFTDSRVADIAVRWLQPQKHNLTDWLQVNDLFVDVEKKAQQLRLIAKSTTDAPEELQRLQMLEKRYFGKYELDIDLVYKEPALRRREQDDFVQDLIRQKLASGQTSALSVGEKYWLNKKQAVGKLNKEQLCHQLASIILHEHCVTKIRLQNMPLVDPVGERFMATLLNRCVSSHTKLSGSLEKISLTNCELGRHNLTVLADALHRSRGASVKELGLHCATREDRKALPHVLLRFLPSHAMRRLQLRGNGIGEVELEILLNGKKDRDEEDDDKDVLSRDTTKRVMRDMQKHMNMKSMNQALRSDREQRALASKGETTAPGGASEGHERAGDADVHVENGVEKIPGTNEENTDEAPSSATASANESDDVRWMLELESGASRRGRGTVRSTNTRGGSNRYRLAPPDERAREVAAFGPAGRPPGSSFEGPPPPSRLGVGFNVGERSQAYIERYEDVDFLYERTMNSEERMRRDPRIAAALRAARRPNDPVFPITVANMAAAPGAYSTTEAPADELMPMRRPARCLGNRKRNFGILDSPPSRLQRLCLTQNNLQDAGCAVLVRHWGRSKFLRELRLDYNRITMTGALAISGGLKHAPKSLEFLSLKHNRLLDRGVACFVDLAGAVAFDFVGAQNPIAVAPSQGGQGGGVGGGPPPPGRDYHHSSFPAVHNHLFGVSGIVCLDLRECGASALDRAAGKKLSDLFYAAAQQRRAAVVVVDQEGREVYIFGKENPLTYRPPALMDGQEIKTTREDVKALLNPDLPEVVGTVILDPQPQQAVFNDPTTSAPTTVFIDDKKAASRQDADAHAEIHAATMRGEAEGALVAAGVSPAHAQQLSTNMHRAPALQAPPAKVVK
eukprot:g8550.t1